MACVSVCKILLLSNTFIIALLYVENASVRIDKIYFIHFKLKFSNYLTNIRTTPVGPRRRVPVGHAMKTNLNVNIVSRFSYSDFNRFVNARACRELKS